MISSLAIGFSSWVTVFPPRANSCLWYFYYRNTFLHTQHAEINCSYARSVQSRKRNYNRLLYHACMQTWKPPLLEVTTATQPWIEKFNTFHKITSLDSPVYNSINYFAIRLHETSWFSIKILSSLFPCCGWL